MPGLSLCFDSGLSSPGLICCLAMSLRYPDLLYLWLCGQGFLGPGFRCLLACPSLSSWLWLCRFLWVLFSIWFTPFAMGPSLRGRGWFVLSRNEGLVYFPFPFWAVSLCCHCPSGYRHHVGQVCWSVPTFARPTVVVGASPFLLLDGLRPLSEASFRALSLQVNFLWPSLRLRLSLLLVGLVPDLRAGSPTSGWRCVLRPAFVPEAIPPSHRLVLRIRAGFLFYGPGVCGGFNRFLLLCIPSGCGHPLGQ